MPLPFRRNDQDDKKAKINLSRNVNPGENRNIQNTNENALHARPATFNSQGPSTNNITFPTNNRNSINNAGLYLGNRTVHSQAERDANSLSIRNMNSNHHTNLTANLKENFQMSNTSSTPASRLAVPEPNANEKDFSYVSRINKAPAAYDTNNPISRYMLDSSGGTILYGTQTSPHIIQTAGLQVGAYQNLPISQLHTINGSMIPVGGSHLNANMNGMNSLVQNPYIEARNRVQIHNKQLEERESRTPTSNIATANPIEIRPATQNRVNSQTGSVNNRENMLSASSTTQQKPQHNPQFMETRVQESLESQSTSQALAHAKVQIEAQIRARVQAQVQAQVNSARNQAQVRATVQAQVAQVQAQARAIQQILNQQTVYIPSIPPLRQNYSVSQNSATKIDTATAANEKVLGSKSFLPGTLDVGSNLTKTANELSYINSYEEKDGLAGRITNSSVLDKNNIPQQAMDTLQKKLPEIANDPEIMKELISKKQISSQRLAFVTQLAHANAMSQAHPYVQAQTYSQTQAYIVQAIKQARAQYQENEQAKKMMTILNEDRNRLIRLGNAERANREINMFRTNNPVPKKKEIIEIDLSADEDDPIEKGIKEVVKNIPYVQPKKHLNIAPRLDNSKSLSKKSQVQKSKSKNYDFKVSSTKKRPAEFTNSQTTQRQITTSKLPNQIKKIKTSMPHNQSARLGYRYQDIMGNQKTTLQQSSSKQKNSFIFGIDFRSHLRKLQNQHIVLDNFTCNVISYEDSNEGKKNDDTSSSGLSGSKIIYDHNRRQNKKLGPKVVEHLNLLKKEAANMKGYTNNSTTHITNLPSFNNSSDLFIPKSLNSKKQGNGVNVDPFEAEINKLKSIFKNERTTDDTKPGMKSVPSLPPTRKEKIGLVISSALEETVQRATGLVTSEIIAGTWSHISQYFPSLEKDPNEHEITKIIDRKDLITFACVVEEFAKEMILPSFMVAGVNECKESLDRIFIGTLIALREVLMLNSDSIFFISRSESSNSTQRAKNQRKKFQSYVLATGLVAAAIGRLDNDADAMIESFKKAIEEYDRSHESFSKHLHKLDSRTAGIRPDGKYLSKEENTAWRIAYNNAREDHPLVKYGNLNENHSFLTSPRPRLSIPKPTACSVFMVQQNSTNPSQNGGRLEVSNDESDSDEGKNIIQNEKTNEEFRQEAHPFEDDDMSGEEEDVSVC